MKLIIVLVACMLLLSCNGTSSQKKENNLSPEGNWQIAYRMVSTHTYTAEGLLDTSFKINYTYMRGIIVDSAKSMNIRKYANKKLVDDKSFVLLGKNKMELFDENIIEYDAKGNVIVNIRKMGGHIVFKTVNEYDDNSKHIRSIEISQKNDNPSSGYSLDSAVAQYGERKKIEYDTIVKKDVDKKVKSDPNTETTSEQDGKFIKKTIHRKETGAVTMQWLDGDKIIMLIEQSDRPEMSRKYTFKYNSKGDEVENVVYRQKP